MRLGTYQACNPHTIRVRGVARIRIKIWSWLTFCTKEPLDVGVNDENSVDNIENGRRLPTNVASANATHVRSFNCYYFGQELINTF